MVVSEVLIGAMKICREPAPMPPGTNMSPIAAETDWGISLSLFCSLPCVCRVTLRNVNMVKIVDVMSNRFVKQSSAFFPRPLFSEKWN